MQNYSCKTPLVDALLIIKSPDLFHVREAVGYEMSKVVLEHNKKTSQMKQSNLDDLQRGLGIVQSKTLRIGNPLGFGTSEPRLCPKKKEGDNTIVCERFIRCLTPTRTKRRCTSLDNINHRMKFSTNKKEVQKRGRQSSSDIPALIKQDEKQVIHLPRHYGIIKTDQLPTPPAMKKSLLPVTKRFTPMEKLCKIIREELSDNIIDLSKNRNKKVRFCGDTVSSQNCILPPEFSCPVLEPNRADKKLRLQANLLSSFTINGSLPTAEANDLVQLIQEDVPDLKEPDKLQRDIEEGNIDIENILEIIVGNLGGELAKALEILKPEILENVSKFAGPIHEEPCPTVKMASKEVMTDFNAVDLTSTMNTNSESLLRGGLDFGTQFDPIEPIKLIDAATSYSRVSEDGFEAESTNVSVSEHLNKSEGEELVFEPSSPPRDPSMLPPPSIDVTTILEEEDPLEKIESVLSRQSADTSSPEQSLTKSKNLRSNFRHAEAQTFSIFGVRSVSRKIQTIQLLSSSSITESSSSTLFTCRETTESEEVPSSCQSLSEGEIISSRLSPGEVIPSQTRTSAPSSSVTETLDGHVLTDDFPRLLTLNSPNRTFTLDRTLKLLW